MFLTLIRPATLLKKGRHYTALHMKIYQSVTVSVVMVIKLGRFNLNRTESVDEMQNNQYLSL